MKFYFLLMILVSSSAYAEYRGYNGRTLEQAYYRCKYEAFRAAAPGDRSKGFFEKMRIRTYVMDSCMESEGFFRKKNHNAFPKDLMTWADVFY